MSTPSPSTPAPADDSGANTQGSADQGLSTPAPTATAAPAATVAFTADDALNIANTVGTLVSAVDPAVAGVVALVTGAASLLRNTVLPAIQHLQSHQISVVEQATLQAEAAAERLRVGAPGAQIN